MARSGRDKQKAERHESLLSQYSRSCLKERSASLTMIMEHDEDGSETLKLPFSDLCKINISKNRSKFLNGEQREVSRLLIMRHSKN